MRLPVDREWHLVILEDRILVAEQYLTQQPERPRDLQHATLALTELDKWLERYYDQSAGQIGPLLDFLQKSQLEDDSCRVSHAEGRPILPTVPG